MASLIMFWSVAFEPVGETTELKTNSQKMVASTNYVDQDKVSYGLVAIKALSSIETEKDAKEMTEDKKEENKESEETKDKDNTSDTKKKTVTKKKTTTTTKKATTKTVTKKKKSSANTNVKLPSNKELGKQIAAYAKQFVGNPYKRGGTSLTKGADCSGFTMSVFKHFGIKLPRGGGSQAKVGVKVPFSKLEPGDLVFYSNGGKKITHVAIYIGGGKIVHARTPKEGIGINSVNIMTKVTARRVVK